MPPPIAPTLNRGGLASAPPPPPPPPPQLLACWPRRHSNATRLLAHPLAARRVDRRGEGSVVQDEDWRTRLRGGGAGGASQDAPSGADADATSTPSSDPSPSSFTSTPWRPSTPATRSRPPLPPSPPDTILEVIASGPYCVWPELVEGGGSISGSGSSSDEEGGGWRPASTSRRFRSLIGGSGFPVPSAYAGEVSPRRRGWRRSPTEGEAAAVAAAVLPPADDGGPAAAATAAATPPPPSPPRLPPPPPPRTTKLGRPRRSAVEAAKAATAATDAATAASVARAAAGPRRGRGRPPALSPAAKDASASPAPKRPRGRPTKAAAAAAAAAATPAELAAREHARAAQREWRARTGRARTARDAADAGGAMPVVFHQAPYRAEARRARLDAATGDPGGRRTLGVTFFDDGAAPRACRARLAAAALTAALARPDHAAALAAAGVTVRIQVASIARLPPSTLPARPLDDRLVSAAEAAGIDLTTAPTIDPASPAGADAVVEADLALVMDAYDASDLVREVSGMDLVAPRGAYSRRVRPLGLYASRPGAASTPAFFPAISPPDATPDIEDPWAYGGTGSLGASAEAWSFADAAAACVGQVAAAAAGLAAHLAADITRAAAVTASGSRISPRAALAAAGLCPLLSPEADADWRRAVAARSWALPSRRKDLQAAAAAIAPTIARPPGPAVADAPLPPVPGAAGPPSVAPPHQQHQWRPLWMEDSLRPAAAAVWATVEEKKDKSGSPRGSTAAPVLYTLRSTRGGPPTPMRVEYLPRRHWEADPGAVDRALAAYIEATTGMSLLPPPASPEAAPSPPPSPPTHRPRLPTGTELRAAGGSSLVRAISRVGGGVSAVAARLGLKPVRSGRTAADDPAALGAALRSLAAATGTPGVMPTYATLAAAGEHALAHAVRRAGGAAAAARVAGLVCGRGVGRPRKKNGNEEA